MPDNAPAQAVTIPSPLPPDALYNRCDPKQFTFATTAELAPLDHVIGQERAVAAVRFGIGIRHDGYNLFAIGPSGTGKHSTVRRFIADRAPQEPTPSDLCYVHNFTEPHKPKALILHAGKGAQFRKDMENLLGLLKIALPATFESDDYRNRRQAIHTELTEITSPASESSQISKRRAGECASSGPKSHRCRPS